MAERKCHSGQAQRLRVAAVAIVHGRGPCRARSNLRERPGAREQVASYHARIRPGVDHRAGDRHLIRHGASGEVGISAVDRGQRVMSHGRVHQQCVPAGNSRAIAGISRMSITPLHAHESDRRGSEHAERRLSRDTVTIDHDRILLASALTPRAMKTFSFLDGIECLSAIFVNRICQRGCDSPATAGDAIPGIAGQHPATGSPAVAAGQGTLARDRVRISG